MSEVKQSFEEKQLKYIFDNMEDAVCVTDKVGCLLHVNAAAKKLLGLSVRTGEEKKIWDAIPYVENNDALVQLFIDAVVSGKSARQALVTYENAEGKKFMLRVSLKYTRDDRELFIIIINDMTEFFRVNAAFVRYTSPQIAAYVLGSPEGEQPGGVSRTVSVLMSDLRGFTSMTAGLKAEQLVEIVNHYFEKMIDVIEKRKGILIEFLGDGIFAVFGALGEDPDHAANAVKCAVEMQNRMREVNEWNRKKGYPELHMGIGINSGEAVVGNIGSPLKMKFGCMGDTVNLAGRTESFTVGGQVFITQDTVSMIDEPLHLEGEYSYLPKGKDLPVTIYDVRGIGKSLRLDPRPEIVWEDAAGNETEIAVHLVDGKIVAAESISGQVKKISADYTHALIHTGQQLELLQNIMLDIGDMLAAKVIRSEKDDYVICFTSRPDRFQEWISSMTER